MSAVGLRLLLIFIDVVLPLAVGYVCKQKHFLTEKQCNLLIRINITVIATLLTILTFWALPLRTELIFLPVSMVLNAFIPIGIIYLFHLQKRFARPADRGSYILAAMLTNLGTLGGLCGYIMYGERAFAYSQLVVVFQNIITFCFAFPLGAYYKYSDESCAVGGLSQMNWRHIFINWNQLPAVGMVIGACLYASGVPRPAVLTPVLDALIHIAAWSGLIPIGFMIEFSSFKQYYKQTLDLVPIKMLITPAIIYVLSTFVFSDPVLIGSLLVLMSMPTAINSLFAVRLYDLNVNLAMSAFITTTVVYVFILYPAFYFLVHASILPFK